MNFIIVRQLLENGVFTSIIEKVITFSVDQQHYNFTFRINNKKSGAQRLFSRLYIQGFSREYYSDREDKGFI